MQGLGFLPGKGLSLSTAVSADGSTVAGEGWGGNGAIRRRFAGHRPVACRGLGFLPGAGFSRSLAVSADGSTIAGNSGSEAFRWTQAGGMQGLGVLAGATFSEASALSADGSTVVGSSSNWTGSSSTSTQEAFRWTESGGMQGLGFLPGWAMQPRLGRFGRRLDRRGPDAQAVPGMKRFAGRRPVACRASAFCRVRTIAPRSVVSADGSVVVGGSGVRAATF